MYSFCPFKFTRNMQLDKQEYVQFNLLTRWAYSFFLSSNMFLKAPSTSHCYLDLPACEAMPGAAYTFMLFKPVPASVHWRRLGWNMKVNSRQSDVRFLSLLIYLTISRTIVLIVYMMKQSSHFKKCNLCYVSIICSFIILQPVRRCSSGTVNQRVRVGVFVIVYSQKIHYNFFVWCECPAW